MVRRDAKPEKATSCVVCGKPSPTGPLDYGWDAHSRDLPGGGFVLDLTCSFECRERGGYRERRPRP